MTGPSPTAEILDRDHLRLGDGTVFHARTGHIRPPGESGPCDCAGDEPVFAVSSYREAVPQLQLSLTDACNMGCTYCSFRDRVHADGKPVTIPLETVRRGIAGYAGRATASGQRHARVDFGLAGETMLVRGMHETVHRLVEDGLADSPVSMAWVGPNVTNATLSMTPELADTLGPPQDISIDGPPHVHDRTRFYTNGRGGTYHDVRSVLDRVLARHPGMGVSAVLTAYCTDFVMIFRHLFDDIGARNIYMKPVNATHDADYALNAATLPAFERGYTELVAHLLDHDADGILERLLALSPEDYLMRFVYRVKDRAVQVYRCGAGKSGAYVDTNGRLYACAHFIGKSGWDIGHVDTGVDPARAAEYTALTVDSREPCRGCVARYVCGGGCHYQAVLANGDIGEPDAVKCALIRTLTTLAVQLVTTLRTRHPEVLAALPTPFGVTPDLATARWNTPYVPAGALAPAADARPVPLGGPGRVRATTRARSGVSVRLSTQDGVLRLRCADGGEATAWRVWLQPFGGDRFVLNDLPVLGPERSGTHLRVADGAATRLDLDSARFHRVPAPVPHRLPADGVLVRREGGETVVDIDTSRYRDGAQRLGVNVYADFADGGWTALALYEPFVALPEGASGPLRLTGPDADGLPETISSAPGAPANALLPDSLVPLGRWTALQPNVC